MRRISVSVTLALLLGLLPAVLGNVAGHPAEASAADITPMPAVPADSVVDGYGVGIHLAYLNTPYSNATAVADALSNLGVRHVRDDLYMNNPLQYAAIRTVAERGIRFDLITGRPTSPDAPAAYVHTVATQLPKGSVESLEGTNEWDLFSGGSSDWAAQLRQRQEDLYAAAKANPATANLPVLSPALAFRWNYPAVGDLSPYADVANAHMYPGGYEPSNEVARVTAALQGAVSGKPVVATESGYHNALNTTNGHHPVPEDVAGVYMPRLLLEHLRRGEKRVYSYELIDEFDEPGLTDPEAHFGLLRHDLSPKPAYTAMKNLLGLVSDPGPAFSPGSLAVKADGFPADGRYLLTQKRNGEFVLLLWRDVRVYDPITQERLPVTPAPVTLRLGETADLHVYRPSEGSVPVSSAESAQLPLSLDGQVTAVTIDPVRAATTASKPAPSKKTRTLGAAPALAAGITPVGEAVPAGATRAGATSTGATSGGTPTTVRKPARPRITSITVRPHRVRVTFRRARGTVTGYRLTVAGHHVRVGPHARVAVVRGLRPGLAHGRRVLVRLWARNDGGWSLPARAVARAR